jgi:metal-dependent hydrolase (beta-lactamase superfamily II)
MVPCHCTGDAAAAALAEVMGDRVTYGKSGMVLRF